MEITAAMVKQLRDETGAGVMESRRALDEAQGDMQRAKTIIAARGLAKAEKKAGREALQGIVDCYIHAGGRIGALVEVNCETDFVARTEDFRALAHEVAMQVAAMNPADVDELLAQAYIRDGSKTIKSLVTETAGKTGENVLVRRFVRFELGGA